MLNHTSRQAARSVRLFALVSVPRRACSSSSTTRHLASSASAAARREPAKVPRRVVYAAQGEVLSVHHDLPITIPSPPSFVERDAILRQELAAHLAENRGEAFNVVNLAEVARQHARWTSSMPRVHPYYAIKSNDDRELISTLAALGVSFDCASPSEIDRVLRLGVAPDRVIYANPCKQPDHIQHASQMGVGLTVFDCEEELVKIATEMPRLKLGATPPKMLLRLLPDDSLARCRLGQKYGADAADVGSLLDAAKRLGLADAIVGVAFHVGSGNDSTKAYADALTMAAEAFRTAHEKGLGKNWTTLDIGGGFSGEIDTNDDTGGGSFESIARAVNASLDEHFPPSRGVDIIAEPGRFYSGSPFTLMTQIIGKRKRSATEVQYFVNQSIYGSFNCILFDHAEVLPKLRVISHAKAKASDAAASNSASVWGQTCDGLDCIIKSEEGLSLPETLDVGDWLAFDDFGAYTSCAGSAFNGFSLPSTRYVCDEESIEVVVEGGGHSGADWVF